MPEVKRVTRSRPREGGGDSTVKARSSKVANSDVFHLETMSWGFSVFCSCNKSRRHREWTGLGLRNASLRRERERARWFVGSPDAGLLSRCEAALEKHTGAPAHIWTPRYLPLPLCLDRMAGLYSATRYIQAQAVIHVHMHKINRRERDVYNIHTPTHTTL